MATLYSEFADIQAIEAQKQDILKIFDQVKQGVKDLSNVGIKIDSSKNIKEVSKALQDLEKSRKDYLALQQKFDTLQEKINQTTQKGVKLSLEEKLANQEALKIQKERIKLRQSEAGSLDQLNLQYNKATRILKGLSEEQRNSTRGQNLIKFAADLDKQLKTVEQRTGNFKRNVGNYANSLASGFDKVRKEIQKLQDAQQKLQQRTVVTGFTPGSTEGKDIEAQMQKNAAAIEELNKVMATADNTGNSFQKTVRQIGFQFQNMSAAGNQSEEFLQEFKEFAAGAKDEADDLRQEIKALASDTRGLDLMVSGISAVASGFEAAAGASALFGADTKDTEKSLRKLVAIQTVANGIREVGNQLTQRGTAANKAYNFVIKQGEVLFGKGSTAAQRFGAALKGILVVALISGLVILIKKLTESGETAEEAAERLDAYNKALKDIYDTEKELNDLLAKSPGINNQILLLKQQLSLQEANGASLASQFATKKKIAQAEKELADQQLQDLIFRAETEESNVDAQLTGLDAVEAAQEHYYNELTSGETQLNQLRRTRIKKNEELTQSDKDEMDKQIKAQENYVSVTRDNYNDYTSIIAGALDKTNALAELEAAERKRRLDAEKAALLELNKFKLDLVIKQAQFDQNENLVNSTNDKVEAAKKEFDARKKLIDDQLAYDLAQNDLADSKKKLLRAKAAEDIFDIELELSQKVLKLRLDANEKEKQLAEQGAADFKEDMDSRLADRTAKLEAELAKSLSLQEKAMAEETKANDERYLKGEISLAQHDKRKAQIDLSFQKSSVEANIIYYEQLMKLFEEFGLDTTELAAKIAKAKAELSGFDVDATKKTAEEIKAMNQEIADNYYQTFLSIADSFNNILGGIAEARKQQLQDQIDEVEKLKAAEIDRVNATGDSEEKKAARIKIIEANAQSQREELARRQRQIDRQRAISERAFKAFQVTTDTITAVNKIRLQIAAAPDPVTKALYTSQLVLAIASGAASLTALLAAPLPKFAKGGTVQKDGPILVGEAGREFGVDPQGRLKLYDNPQIAFATKGTRIYNNEETERMISNTEDYRAMLYTAKTNIWESDTRLLEETKEGNKYLREILKRQGITIVNQQGIESSAWYQQHMKY